MQKAREKYAIFMFVNIAVFLRGGMLHSGAFQLRNSGYESRSPRALAPANAAFGSSGGELGTLMGQPGDLVKCQLADPTYPDPTCVPPIFVNWMTCWRLQHLQMMEPQAPPGMDFFSPPPER